jgi:hypothetical protein
MLIAAGLVSPSNGVDDKISGEPSQMLTRAAVILLSIILVYLLAKKLKALRVVTERVVNKLQSRFTANR